MSRRRRSGTTISLLAFQDIITSVSGIIIVMVLLLTLELVERPAVNASTTTAAVVTELRQAIAEAEQELQTLQAESTATDDLIRIVANLSPPELREQIAARQHEIERLEQRIAKLEDQADRLEAIEESVAVEWFDLKESREELEQLQAHITRLKRQIEQERRDDRPIYMLPRGFRKSGWVVVLEANRITLAPLGRAARPTVLSGTSGILNERSAAEELLQWIDHQGRTADYFLLLVRPSGVSTFDEIKERFTTQRVEFGFDLVEEGQVILHPKRGVAP